MKLIHKMTSCERFRNFLFPLTIYNECLQFYKWILIYITQLWVEVFFLILPNIGKSLYIKCDCTSLFIECDSTSLYIECDCTSRFIECNCTSLYIECDCTSLFIECD
jgi:hypothetical protein